MIDVASPEIRIAIPKAKSLAFLGNPAEGISLLEAKVDSSSAKIDQLAALLAICEILHCDYRDNEALGVFDQRIVPLMGSFSEEIEIAVEFNRSDIVHSLLQNDDFYGLVDRASIADVELWNHRAYYGVIEAREQGKRHESLPNTWQELLRAYYQGCWRSYRLASKLMAIECMDLGWPDEAIYHALVAGDQRTAKAFGTALLLQGNPDRVAKSTSKWLDCTHLKRLFVVGCDILDGYVDAIPDGQFDDVFERVRTMASLHGSEWQEHSCVSRAWNSMSDMSWRLNNNQAVRLLSTAINHPIWSVPIEGGNRVLPVRDKMMNSLAASAAVLPPESVSELVEATVELVVERKQHTDYPNAIELLCRLGSLCGDDAKKRIKEALYQPGKPLDSYLLQVAPNFNAKLKEPESLSSDIDKVADRIRQQFQWLPLSAEVKQLGGAFGFFTVVKDDQKLVVQSISTVHEHAILRHREHLSLDALQKLIDAMLDMISENENLINNKIQLVQVMGSVGDVCSAAQAKQIFNVLSPMANGIIKEPELTQSVAESQNPLNPFKMGAGKPTDLRGVAIFTLSCIERDKPGVFAGELDSIIEAGLTESDPQVRALSLAAAREKPTISEAEFTAVILATRDADPAVANSAFGVLANKEELQLTRPQWRLVIHTAKLAAQSNEVKVRRAAAYACSKLKSKITTNTLRDEMDKLLETLCNDKCASVRRHASE
ncbi:hypothetical protein [Allorhodopirellula solitaria]|nr:hypothetical protein [Allorhodopirellula solitaria]